MTSAVRHPSTQVDFGFLCDAAAAGEEGKLEAFGIGVDTFMVGMVPCLLPLLFVARLSGVEGPARLVVRIVNADGQPVFERGIEGPVVRTTAGRPWKSPLLVHLFVPARTTGDYRLDLLAGGEAIHSVAFWVERL